MSGRPCRDRDHGFATVWSVGGIAVLVLVFTALLAVGAAIATRQRTASAADLAALAAAEHAPDGEQAACDRARWVADQMRVQLDRCWLSGWDALVEMSAALPDPLSGFGSATAHARAGPAEDVAGSAASSGRSATTNGRWALGCHLVSGRCQATTSRRTTVPDVVATSLAVRRRPAADCDLPGPGVMPLSVV